MKKDEILDVIRESDADITEQSVALVRIVMDLLDTTKKQVKGLIIALIVSIVTNIVIVGAFLYYESQFEYVETSKETVTMSTEGDNAEINEVKGNQYNDSSTHNQTGGSVDGESDTNKDDGSYKNSHSDKAKEK